MFIFHGQLSIQKIQELILDSIQHMQFLEQSFLNNATGGKEGTQTLREIEKLQMCINNLRVARMRYEDVC